ncbi:hypothetical protein GCM10025859_17610 [Alicyclobacillus fastidiosus]|nr:hypothetical protein GCM10025859_17610 [Alicyclobacillus fastidiosus]
MILDPMRFRKKFGEDAQSNIDKEIVRDTMGEVPQPSNPRVGWIAPSVFGCIVVGVLAIILATPIPS